MARTPLGCVLPPSTGSRREVGWVGMARILYHSANASEGQPDGCQGCELHGWRGAESLCFSIITEKSQKVESHISSEIIITAPTALSCSLGNKISGIPGWSSKELADWAAINLCF